MRGFVVRLLVTALGLWVAAGVKREPPGEP